MIGYTGPEDQWQVELRKASKSGLVDLIERIALSYGWDRDFALRHAKEAKREGRYIDGMKSLRRFRSDPQKATAEYIRRKKSAKKAANRRKREARKTG